MSTTAQSAKPVSLPAETAPVSTAPKPVDAEEPSDLDAAIAKALGTNVDKPTPVDPDKASADLKKRFAGEEPGEYVDRVISYHQLVDMNAVRTNSDRLRDELQRFYNQMTDNHVIRNRVSDIAGSVVRTVSQARRKEVDIHDSQVQALLTKELEHDVLQNLEVQNAVNAGSVTLTELKQYTFFQNMLKRNPPGTVIRFPEDGAHQDIIRGRDHQWKKLVAGDTAELENAQRIAKDNRPDQQQILDELDLTKEWDGLDPAKQREVIEYATGRSLDRIGQLGDRLLRDRQPVGLVLLTVSGRFSSDHIPLVTGLPQGKELFQRFADIRKNGGEIILADHEYYNWGQPDTISLDPGLKIKGGKIGPGNSGTQFAPYTQGSVSVVEQMMGMKLLEPKPQRGL